MVDKLGNLLLYFSLSGFGKKYLRNIAKNIRHSKSKYPELNLENLIKGNKENKDQRGAFRENLRFVDKQFFEDVPKEYLSESERAPQAVYTRFVTYSAFLLTGQKKFFSAFDMYPDKEADRRLILFGFLQRHYDDLLDDLGATKEDIYNVTFLGRPSDNPELRLLHNFREKIKELIPWQEFLHFYSLLKKTHDLQSVRLTKSDDIKEMTFERARCGFWTNLYVMVNNLPEDVKKAGGLVAEFAQCLDDLADLEEDRKNGILTYVNQSKNPEMIVREKFEQVRTYFRDTAPNPEPFLRSLEKTMNGVLKLRALGIDYKDFIYGRLK